MTYVLLGADGRAQASDVKGQWGGHRRLRIYGRLDCPAALRAIARGGYVRHRVFFADEATALAAGYRPCATCCPGPYQAWKAARRALSSAISKGRPECAASGSAEVNVEEAVAACQTCATTVP